MEKQFELSNNLIKDVPDFKNRLIEIDFPEYLEITYENVLNFFQNVYEFRITWDYKTYKYYGEEESCWLWNVRNKNTGDTDRLGWCYPDTKFNSITDNEEQQTILSIIDYILERIENLDF